MKVGDLVRLKNCITDTTIYVITEVHLNISMPNHPLTTITIYGASGRTLRYEKDLILLEDTL